MSSKWIARLPCSLSTLILPAALAAMGCSGNVKKSCDGSPCGMPAEGGAKPAPQSRAGLDGDGVVTAPVWLKNGGNSPQYPSELYLTGIAASAGQDALKRAMAEAAADLANRVSVRIESELSDVSSEKNGRVDYHLAAITRLTSDVNIQGLKYEIAQHGNEVFALAYVSRTDAVAEHRRLLERSLAELRVCMQSARSQPKAGGVDSVDAYQRCFRPVTEGLQQDALVRSIDPDAKLHKPLQELVQCLQEIRSESARVATRPASSLKQAADYLALQLAARDTLAYQLRDTPSFRYGTTNFSSNLGQQIAIELESAITRRKSGAEGSGSAKQAVIRGVYFEEGENLRIAATLVESPTGKLLLGAETVIAKSNLPAELLIHPKNLETAMQDQRLLAKGELVEGALRVEVWADRGRRGVTYSASEEMRIFLRVNAPAYVRLIYVLESGVQVPIAQSYYIDATKVNLAIEYPERFEIAPPFGIEHIHATAFTKQPEPLAVTTRLIDGVNYEVIADGLASVVRHRGIKRKEKDEVAESLLSVTTLPSTRAMR